MRRAPSASEGLRQGYPGLPRRFRHQKDRTTEQAGRGLVAFQRTGQQNKHTQTGHGRLRSELTQHPQCPLHQPISRSPPTNKHSRAKERGGDIQARRGGVHRGRGNDGRREGRRRRRRGEAGAEAGGGTGRRSVVHSTYRTYSARPRRAAKPTSMRASVFAFPISTKQHSSTYMASDLPPLPCTLVTGFLGAGKTTLLNHMLTQSAGRRIGCLVNEFGAIDIDSTLLASDTVAINSGVVELSNGCICCTINDSLRNAVAAMLQRRTDLDLLLIETTGIADPAPCLTTLWLPEFEGLLRVDGVVTVADATTIARSLASDPKIDAAAAPATDAKATSGGSSSSRIGSSGSSSSGGAASAAAEQKPVCFAQQLASADLLVLNKIDLLWERGAGAKLIQRLVDHLTTLAPRARVLTCQRGRVAIELLLSPSDAVAARAPC